MKTEIEPPMMIVDWMTLLGIWLGGVMVGIAFSFLLMRV